MRLNFSELDKKINSVNEKLRYSNQIIINTIADVESKKGGVDNNSGEFKIVFDAINDDYAYATLYHFINVSHRHPLEIAQCLDALLIRRQILRELPDSKSFLFYPYVLLIQNYLSAEASVNSSKILSSLYKIAKERVDYVVENGCPRPFIPLFETYQPSTTCVERANFKYKLEYIASRLDEKGKKVNKNFYFDLSKDIRSCISKVDEVKDDFLNFYILKLSRAARIASRLPFIPKELPFYYKLLSEELEGILGLKHQRVVIPSPLILHTQFRPVTLLQAPSYAAIRFLGQDIKYFYDGNNPVCGNSIFSDLSIFSSVQVKQIEDAGGCVIRGYACHYPAPVLIPDIPEPWCAYPSMNILYSSHPYLAVLLSIISQNAYMGKINHNTEGYSI